MFVSGEYLVLFGLHSLSAWLCLFHDALHSLRLGRVDVGG